MAGLGAIEYVKLAVFYASYLAFPAFAFLAWVAATRSVPSRIVASFLFVPLILFIYARFIEPRRLLTVTHEAELSRCFAEDGHARVALISDLHQGLFPNIARTSRVADAIKKAHPDIALVAGDFVYFLAPKNFEKTFAPLGRNGVPTYAVLGNHDVGLPGPDVGTALKTALENDGVHIIDDEKQFIDIEGAQVQLVGLSDLWAHHQKLSLLEGKSAVPRFALAHNPNTILSLHGDESLDILFSGHTHGGQINIPGVTCNILPSMCRVTRYGFAETRKGLVFVTSGVGMVALPMRFNAAPRVDIIDLSWRKCD